MSNFDIPEEIMDVAWRVFTDPAHEGDQVAALADAITAAAPLIVATELKEFINRFEAFIRVRVSATVPGIENVPGLAMVILSLRQRIDELEQLGGAS